MMRRRSANRAAGGGALFADRADAGRQLARRLAWLLPRQRGAGHGTGVVVAGLPRGGMPVAFEVARELAAPLDVIVVRKLGVPDQPELGFGAVGEDGALVIDNRTVALACLTGRQIAAVETRERGRVAQRVAQLRGGRPPVPLAGRTVVVVDDGIATGSTARAACQVARARGASSVVLAVPVGPAGALAAVRADADEVVCLRTPEDFFAVGEWYADFSQTSDDEVAALLNRAAVPRAPGEPDAAAAEEAAGTDSGGGAAGLASGGPGAVAGGVTGVAGGDTGGTALRARLPDPFLARQARWARQATELLSGRFSAELGIDVDAGDAEVERWFLAATLFGARISASVAERTFTVLAEAGLTRIGQARHLLSEDLVSMLDAGGYARYDFRTATRLQDLAEVINERYDGQAAAIGRAHVTYPELRVALLTLPGWGPVTGQLFLRELRGVWPGAQPPLDPRAGWAARHIGLLDGGPAETGAGAGDGAAAGAGAAGAAEPGARLAELARLAEAAGLDLRDLESAMVRLALAHRRVRAYCPGGRRCAVLDTRREARAGLPVPRLPAGTRHIRGVTAPPRPAGSDGGGCSGKGPPAGER